MKKLKLGCVGTTFHLIEVQTNFSLSSKWIVNVHLFILIHEILSIFEKHSFHTEMVPNGDINPQAYNFIWAYQPLKGIYKILVESSLDLCF